MVKSTKSGAGRKLVSTLMSVVLAVGLMPLPAYATTDSPPPLGSLTASTLITQDAGDGEPEVPDYVTLVASLDNLKTVKSAGFESGTYSEGYSHRWAYSNVEATNGISITFSSDTETEATFDYITVYSDYDSDFDPIDDAVVVKCSGDTLKGETVYVPARQTGGTKLMVDIKTDDTVNKKGFAITDAATLTAAPDLSQNPSDSPVTVSASQLQGLKSDGFDTDLGEGAYKGYARGLEKTWTYTDAGATYGLKVTFDENTSIGRKSSLAITDGNGGRVGSEDNRGASLAGKTLYVPAIAGGGGTSVTLTLKTLDGGYRGFAITSVNAMTESEAKALALTEEQRHEVFSWQHLKINGTPAPQQNADLRIPYTTDGAITPPTVSLDPTGTAADAAGIDMASFYKVELVDVDYEEATSISGPGEYGLRVEGIGPFEGEYAWRPSGEGDGEEWMYTVYFTVYASSSQMVSLINSLNLSQYSALEHSDTVDSQDGYNTAKSKSAKVDAAKKAIQKARDAYYTLDSEAETAFKETDQFTLYEKYDTLLQRYRPVNWIDELKVGDRTFDVMDEGLGIPVYLDGKASIAPEVSAFTYGDGEELVPVDNADNKSFVVTYAKCTYDDEKCGYINGTAAGSITEPGSYSVLLTGKGFYYGETSYDAVLDVRAQSVHASLASDGTLTIQGTTAPTAAAGTTVYTYVDQPERFTIETEAWPVEAPAWFADRGKIKKVQVSGTIKPSNMDNWFYGCSELEAADLGGVDVENKTSMRGLFHGCDKLAAIKFPAGFNKAGEWQLDGVWVNPSFTFNNSEDDQSWSWSTSGFAEKYNSSTMADTWKLVAQPDGKGGTESYWAPNGSMRTFVYPPALDDSVFVYDGTTTWKPFSPGIDDPYTVADSGDSGYAKESKDAGNFTVTLKLADAEHAVWGPNSSMGYSVSDMTFDWSVKPQAVDKPATEIYFSHDGQEHVGVPASDYYTVQDGGTSKATEVGDYTATVSLKSANYKWSDNTTGDFTVNWSIIEGRKETVALPEVKDTVVAYTGEEQIGFDAAPTEAPYTLTGALTGTNAGTYTVTASLKNKAANEWQLPDGTRTAADQTIEWSIPKASVPKPTANPALKPWELDDPDNGEGVNQVGVVIAENALYEESSESRYSEISATEAGDYTAVLKLKDANNYKWASESDPEKESAPIDVAWSIPKRQVAIPTSGKSIPHDGKEHGIADIAASADEPYYDVEGMDYAEEAGTYTCTLHLNYPSNTTWADGTLSPKDVTWSITNGTRTQVALPSSPAAITYDGQPHTPFADTAQYTVSGDVTKTAVGSYTATFTLKDPEGSEWSSDHTNTPKTVTWSIAKAQVPLPVAVANLVYDNTDKIGVPSNDLYTLAGEVTGKNAGEYTAKATLKDSDNYEWADNTFNGDVKWTIAKAKVEAPTVAPVHYTGGENDSGLKATTQYTVSGDVKGTDIKEYTAKVKLVDPDNYEWADSTTAAPIAAERDVKWRVVKGLVDVPKAVTGLVYNGAEQGGIEAMTGALYTATGNTATNAGAYTAKVALSDLEHYTWADGTVAYKEIPWEIAQAPVTVAAKAVSKAYSDADPVLTATVTGLFGKDTITYALSRAKGEAPGSYAIVASGAASQGNYKVTFRGATFTITKKSISLAKVSLPAKTYRYTGKAITPEPTVKLGKVTLADKGDYTVSYKSNKKKGTATVTVTGKGNYTGTAKTTFKISKSSKVKYDPTITVAKKSKSVKASTVKKKAQTIEIGAAANSGGKLTYKVTKSNPRVSFEGGKAMLKKGTPKGTYSINVRVTAKAKGKYAKGSETFTITFKVK